MFICDYEHCHVPLKYRRLHKTIVGDEQVRHKSIQSLMKVSCVTFLLSKPLYKPMFHPKSKK